jgi:hypothetical protein
MQKAKKSSRRSSRRGKPQKPTKGKKSGKAKQNGKEELGNAQQSKKRSNQGKSSISAQKLKINTPPNTLNASSPP